MKDAFITTNDGSVELTHFGNKDLLPKHKDFAVLILHGFTSSSKAVSGIIPYLEKEGIPYQLPILRGHGTNYKDLAGIGYKEWLDDANKAYQELSSKYKKVLVIGLSMGGLLALNLAAKRKDCIGVITWAAALSFSNPAAHLAGLLKKFVKFWPAQESFNSPECRKNNSNYPRFPSDSFHSLYIFSKLTKEVLDQVTAPICIIHSKKDYVVKLQSAKDLLKQVRAPYRELHLLSESGHELGQDMEAEKVFEISMRFIRSLRDNT